MSYRQRGETSSLSGASAFSSNSTSSAAPTRMSPDATDTTMMTKVITRTETKTATATGSGTRISSAISAGIGTGTGIMVAGLILLLVAAVVFFRRRKRRDPDPTPPTPSVQTSSSAPLVLSPEVRPRPRPTGLAALPKRCRLRGTIEGDIRGQLTSLGLLIRTHVEGDNYHRDTISTGPDTLHESLCQLQLSEDTRRMVVRLSIDPNTRYVAIRHLLALVIFSNLDTHSVSSLSLLPPALKELSKSLPEASSESQDPLVEPALVAWNRLTAFLMHDDPEGGDPLPLLPSVESQVKALVTLLQKFLMHFARTDDDDPPDIQQTRLENAITACVEFGYTIFSDPCDWKFIFSQEEMGVLVLPGIEKHRDNMGELFDSPKVILPPKVVDATED